jgi:hypothetical protein
VHPSHPQPRSQRLPEASAHVGTRVPIGRNAGGHGEGGMESEEGTAFESLPRRKLCRNTVDQPFLFLNPQFTELTRRDLCDRGCNEALQLQ